MRGEVGLEAGERGAGHISIIGNGAMEVHISVLLWSIDRNSGVRIGVCS